MPSIPTSSSSSTERDRAATLEPGTELGGFRLERLIGRGSVGAVYEATQLSLDRMVALRVIPSDDPLAARALRLEWPDHPNVLGLYATGASQHDTFLAMQLVRDASLADLCDPRPPGAGRALEILEAVALALDAAHAKGIVHGALNARNVFVAGGGVLVTDFGLGSAEATPHADLAAFGELARELLGPACPPPSERAASAAEVVERVAQAFPRAKPPGSRRARRSGVVAAVAAIGAAVTVALVLVLNESGPLPGPDRAPPLGRGERALGSGLAATGVRSRDCGGRGVGGAAQACTMVQTRLPRRRLSAARSGAIRRWIVRGGRGQLTLQVLRRSGSALRLIARSQPATVPDGGVHAFATDLPVRAGDVVGLDVGPDSAIGVRPQVRGATVGRWLGAVDPIFQRALSDGHRTLPGAEMMLRVDYVPRAHVKLPPHLVGRAAARAPAGRAQRTLDVEVRGGATRTVAAVVVGGRVAVDLLDRGRRLERVFVPGARPGGDVADLISFGHPAFRLSWRNPGGAATSHEYLVRSDRLSPRS